jgi:ferredoxin
MEYAYWFLTGSAGLFLLAASLTSFDEKEMRAGWILLLSAALASLLFIIPFIADPNPAKFQLLFTLASSLLLLLLFLPVRNPVAPNDFSGLKRFHEEDAVLSRRLLKPGTKTYNDYYTRYPERKTADDNARANPGLLSDKAPYYDPLTFGAARANFTLTDQLHSLEEIPVAEGKKQVDSKKITAFIHQWLTSSGAVGVGFTPLKDYHLYSHKGRGSRAGEKLSNDLPHAIALTVEMDYGQMKYAPAGPTVLESSRQYLRSGLIATHLSLMIREMGYNAKAHIDGNYEVICPLVAEDAGLGVIGRMGLLMTPRFGPRVRIAVVTTDLPLEYHEIKANPTPVDFCKRCRKCALVCPAAAIPAIPKTDIEGTTRWQINSEKCYNFWTLSGTDCGRCMIACPFAHPDNWFHRFIRWGIQNNLLFRIMAAKLDDVFYGKKPPIRKLPDHLMYSKVR